METPKTPVQLAADEIIESFKQHIGESDFHVPEFISGVSMLSREYKNILEDETDSVAIQCAIQAQQMVVDSLIDSPIHSKYAKAHEILHELKSRL